MTKLENKNKAHSNKITVVTIILFCLSILQIVFIFSNSLLDRANSSKNSGAVRQVMQNVVDATTKNTSNHIEITEHFVRKLAHFTEFFVLGILLCTLFILIFYNFYSRKYSNKNHHLLNFLNRHNVCKIFVATICFSAIIATSDELLQFISGRAPMVQDVLLDTSSALLGIVVVLLIARFICRKKIEKQKT